MSKFLKGYVFSPREMLSMTAADLESSLASTRGIMFSIKGEHKKLMRALQEQTCYIQRELSVRKHSLKSLQKRSE